MPNSIEITPQERAKLGRDTLLQWSTKENKAKLGALRKEISDYLKSGATDKLEKLRVTIIKNTRKDLEKIKNMTDKERDKKAKDFADKVIRYVKENKDLNDVFFTSRVEIGPEKPEVAKNDREKLVQEWINNNPEKLKPTADSPKHFAMKEIKDIKKKQEAFMLLGLIEKFWGKEEAWEWYARSWQKKDQKKPGLWKNVKEYTKKYFWWGGVKSELIFGTSKGGPLIYDYDADEDSRFKKQLAKKGEFNIGRLRSFFTRSKTQGRLGFYYGTRIIKWDPEATAGTWTADHFQSTIHFENDEKTTVGFTDHFKVKVKGWWAHDEVSEIKGYETEFIDKGQDFEKDILGRLRPRGQSRYEDRGDEWLGRDFLEASKYVHKELLGKKSKNINDSGVDPDQEQVILDLIKELKEEVPKVYPSAVSKKIVAWFSKPERKNKWVKLDEKIIGSFNFLFGREIGGFMYRYHPDHKRIYFLKMQNVAFKSEWADVGYIDIKDGKVNAWHDKKDPEVFLKKEIVDKMKDKEIKDELGRFRVEKSEGTDLEKLAMTKGLCLIVSRKLTKAVEYNKIKDDYIAKLKDGLKKFLAKKHPKFKPELIENIAEIRANYVEKKIHDFIDDDEIIKKAVEDDEREKLIIEINSSDEIKVVLRDKGKLGKLKAWAKKKAEGVKTTASDVASGTMARLEKKLERFLGPLTPVAMWFLDKYFKVGDIFKKMARGGTSLLGGLLTSALGIKVSKDILKSKKITQEIIEKLPPKKKKYFKFKKKMYFGEDVTLKGKKIVIPKGKGLKPGKKFEVKVKGITSKVTVLPLKEKKGSLWGIFGRKKEQYRLQEKEITIAKGTTIPKGTVIPKGAKIYKA